MTWFQAGVRIGLLDRAHVMAGDFHLTMDDIPNRWKYWATKASMASFSRGYSRGFEEGKKR